MPEPSLYRLKADGRATQPFDSTTNQSTDSRQLSVVESQELRVVEEWPLRRLSSAERVVRPLKRLVGPRLVHWALWPTTLVRVSARLRPQHEPEPSVARARMPRCPNSVDEASGSAPNSCPSRAFRDFARTAVFSFDILEGPNGLGVERCGLPRQDPWVPATAAYL